MDSHFTALSELVCLVRTTIAKPGCYPVIGAEGDDWFVEISTGDLLDREILTTFLVTIGDAVEVVPFVAQRFSEFNLTVPSAAHLLGFIGLLEKALGSRSSVLHPLTDTGDYFPDWKPALDNLSDLDVAGSAVYVTTSGESIAGIALRQLHDERRWAEIRDLNAAKFPDMQASDYYPVGTRLIMPSQHATRRD